MKRFNLTPTSIRIRKTAFPRARAGALCCLFIAGPLALPAQVPEWNDPRIQAPYRAPIQAYAFDLREVRLLPGPFRRAMDLDREYLLALDPDRLLHTFRLNAGLPSSAQPLGGWEEPKGELRGHSMGHYLSACALMYASTGEEPFREKTRYLVGELAKCQQAIGSGFLSAYPEEFIDRVEAQRRVWAPYYTLHKIYAGLLDVYVYCDNPQALEVCKKFADWAVIRNAKLTDEQMQAMLGNEHGGMNETLANLYALTGEDKYLKIAQRFNHLAVIGPAAQREDKLTGLHANTQIPKFVGTARQYELTGEDSLKTASIFFWDTVVNERSYVIGGHSDGEAFSPKEKLSQALGPNTTETCNTYNMLKLTRHLFCWEPRASVADYYERALYNHILASQNPGTGMMCYYVPLRSGSRKQYNTPNDSFWCCTGTGIENHAKYGDSIYFHNGKSDLWLNLFIASELNWKAKGVTLRQETQYPDEAASRLVLTCEKPVELNLHIRHPFWATAGLVLRVNGQPQDASSKPGSYAVLSRTWQSGDTVEVSMPFSLRTEGFRDNPDRFAFLHGPLVLCAEVDPKRAYPAVVTEQDQLLSGLKPVAGRPSTFAAPARLFRVPGEPGGGDLTLEPFHKMHGNRPYVVYWDRFTPAQWQAKEAQYKQELARQKELEARTVDNILVGHPQSERDHNLQGEKTGDGDFNDRKWRHAIDGGWFSYELKVLPGQPQELSVTYWGSDGGNRVFDILVDGRKLATQRLESNQPGKFFEETYPIPADLTQGKEKVTVKFQAQPGAWAGGVFGVRVLRKGEPPAGAAVPAAPSRITGVAVAVVEPAAAVVAPGAPSVNVLSNASFEQAAENRPRGWRPERWGGQGAHSYAEVGRTGRRSVMLSSDQGADISWTATVPVEPFTRYRLSGWIKTENLDPGTGRGALLNLHNLQPVATKPVTGTKDWTRVEAQFETEDQDALQVNCLFGGWGLAKGKAWYDDLQLEPIGKKEMPAPRITVDAEKVGEPISKFIYGQFIEHLGRCIYGGIWAEMLEDRKFFDPVGAGSSPWKPLGPPESVTMVGENPFVGEHTPRVQLPGDGSQRGMMQGGLALRKGRRYEGRIWLAGDPKAAPVRVSLIWGENPADRQTITVRKLTGAYARTSLRFTARGDTDSGRLEIDAAGSGHFQVGTVSLMPADNVQGMRADTLALLKQLDSPVYRWPGGNFVSGYNWKDGLGDPDRRPPRKNPAWQGIEHNDFGLDEFMTFCRLLKTEPYITVNTGLGEVQGAVEELEYANGSADTPMGKLRVQHGVRKPYGVKFWAIGNEMYGGWQLGHMPLEQYVRKHNHFVEAMRAVDPNIQVVAVGAVGPWSEGMMKHSANHMDYISEHFYCQERPGLYGHVRQIPNEVRRIGEAHRRYRRQFDSLRDKDIRIALDEWNYWYGPHVFGELGTRYFLKDGLGIAAGLHEYARNSDLYFMANYAQTVNVIGCIKTTKTAAAFETTGLVLKLYRRHFGELPVHTQTAGLLDAQAAWSKDRKTLTVAIVNPTSRALDIPFEVRGARLKATGRRWQLAGPDPMAFNDPDQPPKMTVEEAPVQNLNDTLPVAPCSVTLFALETQ